MRREVTVLPAVVLVLPRLLQPAHHRGREVGRVAAEQRREGLLEVPGRDATEIQNRQQRVQAPCAACPSGQDRRAEPHRLSRAGIAVADLRPACRDRAHAGLDHAFRADAVARHAPTPVLEPRLGEAGHERVGLRHQRLSEDAPRPLSGERRQRVVDLVALAKGQDAGRLAHGVSLHPEVLAGSHTRLDTPLSSDRHHPVSAIALASSTRSPRSPRLTLCPATR